MYCIKGAQLFNAVQICLPLLQALLGNEEVSELKKFCQNSKLFWFTLNVLEQHMIIQSEALNPSLKNKVRA